MANKTKKAKRDNTLPTKIERTGTKDFVVHHEDGSYFECKVDDPKRLEAVKGVKGTGVKYSFGGFGKKKPLVCDNCNKQVHKITTDASGNSLCVNCI